MRYERVNTRKNKTQRDYAPQGAFYAQCASCDQWRTCKDYRNAPLCVVMCLPAARGY